MIFEKIDKKTLEIIGKMVEEVDSAKTSTMTYKTENSQIKVYSMGLNNPIIRVDIKRNKIRD